jgi:hypothetical protein
MRNKVTKVCIAVAHGWATWVQKCAKKTTGWSSACFGKMTYGFMLNQRAGTPVKPQDYEGIRFYWAPKNIQWLPENE